MKKLRIPAFISLIILFYISINLFAQSNVENIDNIDNIDKKKKIQKNSRNAIVDSIVFSGADEGDYIKMADSGEGFLVLRGNIKMVFNSRTIFSKMVVYNRNTGDVTFSGDVLFEEGDNKISAEKCIFNVRDNAGVLYNPKSIQKPIFFDTEKIRIVNRKTYIAEDMKFTTCDLERPHYHFLVDKVIMYRDKRVIAYGAIYVVGDIPIFYFPVIVHSDDGIGIITQFGENNRRGRFMQNTLKYTSESGNKWKYKLDNYEKLGSYGGVEFYESVKDFNMDLYLGGSKYRYVNENFDNIPKPDNESDDWFKTVLNTSYNFNRRGNSYTYSNISFYWMNNWYFEQYFDNRNVPEKTFEMIGFLPVVIKEKERINWSYAIGDKGENYNTYLNFNRTWFWDETMSLDQIENYSIKGKYVRELDTLPSFHFDYNDSFFLFNKESQLNTSESASTRKQIINWTINFDSNSLRYYRLNDPGADSVYRSKYYSTTNTTLGYFTFNTNFQLFNIFTYTPGIKLGFTAKWVQGSFLEGNEKQSIGDDKRKAAEKEAEKYTFQYVEPSNNLKIGLTNYYIQMTHYYRRSYLEREVVEPFIHEKMNYIIGGIYIYPVEDISMTVVSSYDFRQKLPFEDDRLKDIIVTNSFYLDFYRYLYNKKSKFKKNQGFFYSGINIFNKYQYVSKDKKSGYNTFDLSFMIGNFSFPGIKLIKSVVLGYNYFHDYRYQFRDTMSIRWGIDSDVSRLWRVQLGGNSQADRAHLYYSEKNDVNFFDDMEKSLYFYSRDKSKDAVFTLRNLYVNIIHDLHCWEIGLFYNFKRKTGIWGPENKDRLIYYDQSFFISLTLKAFSGTGFEKTQVYPIQQRLEKEY